MSALGRRAFLSALVATASGIGVPEPVRAYSFLTNNPIATEWRDTVFVLTGGIWLAAQKERVRADWPTVTIGKGPCPGLEGDYFRVDYAAKGFKIYRDASQRGHGLFMA